jgi:hypothetical protein
MAIALSATPLPDEAAVRLRLDSVVGYNTIIEDYSVAGLAANQTYSAGWVPTGAGITVSGSSDRIGVATQVSDGTRYVTRTLTGLTIGSRYSVTVWVPFVSNAQVVLSRGATQVRYTYGNPSAMPSAGTGATYLVYEFVASATTEAVRLTPRTASGGVANFWISGISIRQVPTQRLTYYQDQAVNDSVNWTQIAGTPAGGSPVFTSGSSVVPTGQTEYNVWGEYKSTGVGVTATYAGNTHGLRRTVSGLTVGQKYRVNLYSWATLRTFVNGTGTTQPLQMAVGVQGKGMGMASTGRWLTYEFMATATSHVIEARIVSSFSVYGGNDPTRQTVNLQQWMLYVEDLYASLTDAYTLTSLTRADNNGTRPVRLYEGQGLSDGVLVTVDPEPALRGLVSYTAVVHDSVGNTDVTVYASTSLDSLVHRSRIAPASIPSQGQWYDLAPEMSLGRSTTTTLAQVINRPDPLVTLGSQTLRSGTMQIFANDYQMGAALEAVFNRGEIVFVRQADHPGLDMYIVGTRTSLNIQSQLTTPRRWILEVDYSEVAAPTTLLRGSIGWTVATSLARNSTLAASRAEFPTVLDLLIGPSA